MSLFDQFTTDPKLEIEGVWLSFGTFQLRIARSGGANAAFDRAVETHFKEHRRAAQANVLPEAVAIRQTILAFADAVVTGWRDINPDGSFVEGVIAGPRDASGERKPLEFGRDNVIFVLTKTATTLLPLVKQYSEDWQTYTSANRELDAGN